MCFNCCPLPSKDCTKTDLKYVHWLMYSRVLKLFAMGFALADAKQFLRNTFWKNCVLSSVKKVLLRWITKFQVSIVGQFCYGLMISKQQNKPAHEIMALFLLRKLILQTHMRSHPVRLDVWFLVGPFVFFHTSCVRTAKALARLRDAQARLSLRWSPMW